MKRDGYEADKNDIIVDFKGIKLNLTSNWDGTVDSFKWSVDGKKCILLRLLTELKQLFEVNFPGFNKIAVQVRQITNGDFDVNEIVSFTGDNVIVTRSDMNHAIYLINEEKVLETIDND
jgi:hypothetical protein